MQAVVNVLLTMLNINVDLCSINPLSRNFITIYLFTETPLYIGVR